MLDVDLFQLKHQSETSHSLNWLKTCFSSLSELIVTQSFLKTSLQVCGVTEMCVKLSRHRRLSSDQTSVKPNLLTPSAPTCQSLMQDISAMNCWSPTLTSHLKNLTKMWQFLKNKVSNLSVNQKNAKKTDSFTVPSMRRLTELFWASERL